MQYAQDVCTCEPASRTSVTNPRHEPVSRVLCAYCMSVTCERHAICTRRMHVWTRVTDPRHEPASRTRVTGSHVACTCERHVNVKHIRVSMCIFVSRTHVTGSHVTCTCERHVNVTHVCVSFTYTRERHVTCHMWTTRHVTCTCGMWKSSWKTCHMSHTKATPCHMSARPNQSCMFPYRWIDFTKAFYLSSSTHIENLVPEILILQNLILRTRSCVAGFITQSGWLFHFHQTTLVWWKWFVPQLYQFRRGISGGPALKYFCMIHRGGQTCDMWKSLWKTCIGFFEKHTHVFHPPKNGLIALQTPRTSQLSTFYYCQVVNRALLRLLSTYILV